MNERWQKIGTFILAGFLLLALVFVVRLKTSPADTALSSPLPSVPLPSVSPGQFVHVVDTRSGCCAATLQTGEGATIVIQVISDTADTVKIEGYDLTAEVTPDTPAVFRFTAAEAGMFDVTLEKKNKMVALLWVAEKKNINYYAY